MNWTMKWIWIDVWNDYEMTMKWLWNSYDFMYDFYMKGTMKNLWNNDMNGLWILGVKLCFKYEKVKINVWKGMF